MEIARLKRLHVVTADGSGFTIQRETFKEIWYDKMEEFTRQQGIPMWLPEPNDHLEDTFYFQAIELDIKLLKTNTLVLQHTWNRLV